MARTQSFTRTASTILMGGGTASIGPSLAGEVWNVQSVAVSASSNVTEATCLIYAGSQVSQGTFVDGTTWGSTGDSTNSLTNPVYPGQQVFAVWTGGDPDATATMVITGTRQVP